MTAYGHAYAVDYTPFQVSIKSLGPDSKPSDDDIAIGSLDISR
jgi:hypothetical protein